MSLNDLKVGDTATGSVAVAPEHFASRIVAGTPDVFSTASLCALVEKTAAEWMRPLTGGSARVTASTRQWATMHN